MRNSYWSKGRNVFCWGGGGGGGGDEVDIPVCRIRISYTLVGSIRSLGSLSKTGRRRQREEPGKDCFRVFLCLFLSWLKFLPFLPKFYCFIVSKYERATVVISQKWRSRPVNNLKLKHLKSQVRHDDPEIMSISHIHVLLLSSAIILIVSLTLPSWSPVLVLKLPIIFHPAE